MKRLSFPVAAAVTLFLLGGCVPTQTPVGSTISPTPEAEFVGTWQVKGDDTKLDVVVKDAAAGHIIATEQGEEDAEPTHLFFRTVGDQLIINWKAKEKLYAWVLAEKSDDKIVCYLPNHKTFKRLVDEGVLKKPAEKSDAPVASISDEMLKEILEGKHGEDMFVKEKPLVYERVKK